MKKTVSVSSVSLDSLKREYNSLVAGITEQAKTGNLPIAIKGMQNLSALLDQMLSNVSNSLTGYQSLQKKQQELSQTTDDKTLSSFLKKWTYYEDIIGVIGNDGKPVYEGHQFDIEQFIESRSKLTLTSEQQVRWTSFLENVAYVKKALDDAPRLQTWREKQGEVQDAIRGVRKKYHSDILGNIVKIEQYLLDKNPALAKKIYDTVLTPLISKAKSELPPGPGGTPYSDELGKRIADIEKKLPSKNPKK